MRKGFVVCSAFVLAFIAASCDRRPKEVKITNIVRIFMHERGHYTFLVRQDDETLTPVTYNGGNYGCRSSEVFITDVPDCALAWATYGEERNPLRNVDCTQGRLVIHLHATSEILAAGWNHGKFGSGLTQVVE